MSKSSNWESTIKPIVVLSVISLIASLLRGQGSGRQHCDQGRGKGL